MENCKADVSMAGMTKQALASSTPVLATLLLLGWTILSNQSDSKSRLSEAEKQLRRIEEHLRSAREDLDTVERRTRKIITPAKD